MKLHKYIPLLLISSFFASCEIECLPISEISEEAYYSTTDEVATGLVACYTGLQEPMDYEWQLTELRSDNTRIEELSSTSTATIRNIEFDKCSVTTTNESVYNYWYYTYKNIANCNTVLDAMGVVEDEADANEIEGQARFIRAYHYFNLVRLFGPVFIVDTRISAQEASDYTRRTVSDVYEFIINDLELAEEMLADVVYDSGNEARVTTWSAKALLGKVYMTLQDYATAKTYLEDVINNGGFSLQDTYEDVFSISNECNSEIIFTIRYTSGGLGLGSPFGNWFAPQQSGSYVINNDGSSYNYPTSIIISAFTAVEANLTEGTAAVYDLRKDLCVREGYQGSSWIDDAYINKFISEVVNDEDGDVDWPIIRYADVLLLYAEALNEISGPSYAIPYINMTRSRGGLDDLVAADYTTKHFMRLALEDERQKEFAFENQRWFDLVRTDRAVEVVNQAFIDDSFYADEAEDMNLLVVTENMLLLPIPQAEIDANPTITQNAGY